MRFSDTIYALSTAWGMSGVAVVRVSGPQAFSGLQALTGKKVPPPRQALVRRLIDTGDQHLIDQALVLPFEGPHSFTGEDIVEYHIHGGVAVIDDLLRGLATLPGYRLAEAGEFTRRAFENGKMDLTAAEGIGDLIHAETEAQKAQALSQMEGSLAKLYDQWAQRLTRALAHLEADLDFPDEDLPQGVAHAVTPLIADFIAELDAHLNDNRRGERLRDGIHVVVIGAPNAGKSSLVNALAQRDVAIVSEHAGTTRDIIEAHLNLGGFPVILSDTAGLRPDQIGQQGQDAIEGEGIRRALERAARADIRVLVFDASLLPAMDPHTVKLIGENTIIVFNKADQFNGDAAAYSHYTPLWLSIQNLQGLESLTDVLLQQIRAMIGTRTAPSLSRARHRTALEDCRVCLMRALQAPLPELMAEDVRLALRALGRITGRVDVEDLLDVIFRDFCIGK
ncbi:MAG TPA: tRNA uridine-5-carboxymethylaminomethyl(34) synthesis GTPase MnmE [Micavibrio sp.]